MNSAKNITTLIFDWDGTLIDSAHTGFIAFRKSFEEMNIDFTREFFEATYSPNWYTMYEALSLPENLWKTADERWLFHYNKLPPVLVDHAERTLGELKNKGYRLGIVTSGTESRVKRELETLGLKDYFAAVICNESVTQKKPHPEGLEKAIRSLQVSKEHCSYIGDAPEDIQMGKNAQVSLTVAVRSAYPTSKKLWESDPDIYLDSIDELLLHF